MKPTKAYYHGFFKIHEVEVLEEDKYKDFTYGHDPIFFYKYIIKFKSGKLKYVSGNKITFITNEGDDMFEK